MNEIAIVLVAMVIMIALLVSEVFRPEKTIFLTLVFFLLSGVITVDQALQGFSNQGMLTIALLFAISGAIERSKIVGYLVQKLLKENQKPQKNIMKLLLPTTFFSSFLNNTPIVMVLIPEIRKWCREKGEASSKWLIPISYAAIFGGTITLIGTSTNLVVHGLMLDQGLDGISMFQPAIVGIPCTIIGFLYLRYIGYHLLPKRKGATDDFEINKRQFLSKAVAKKDSELIGQKVKNTNLFGLKGLDVLEIVSTNKKRRTRKIGDYKIKENDLIFFSGDVQTILELTEVKGISLLEGTGISLDELESQDSQLVEVVISQESEYIHQKIKNTDFRIKHGASIVAVCRDHRILKNKIGEIILKPGDVLLLLVEKEMAQTLKQSNDVFVLSFIQEKIGLNKKELIITMATFLLMILTASLQIISMFQASLFAFIILLLTKIIKPKQLRKSNHYPILFLIACSIGIGGAITETGAGEFLAQHILSITMIFGLSGVIVAVYLLTNLLTETVTNTAAAVIMFPIVLEMSNILNIPYMALIMPLIIAASASFSTPIGYQTNLMVYSAGGYRFSDFIKVGLPLNILFMITTTIVVTMVYL